MTKIHTHPKTIWSALLGGFLAISASAAETTNLWETTIAAGLSLTRGNSETLLGVLSIDSKRKTARDEILLGAAGAYGENEVDKTVVTASGRTIKTTETDKTTETLSAYGQYNYSLTERWYAGLRLDFLHDAIADLDYRFTISPLIGYYAIKEPATTLKFEAGPSGVFEHQGDEDDQYVALRLGERFEHKFSDKAKVWQSFDYLPQVDRWHNYLIVAELGAEASFTTKLSLRAVLQDYYDNEPAPHRKNNDIKLITSLVYKF